MALPDSLVVYRALLAPREDGMDWMDEDGNPTARAFYPSTIDVKSGLSLMGGDRVTPFEIPARMAKWGKVVRGAAEIVVGEIRSITSLATGGDLDVVRTQKEEADDKNPHCAILGLQVVPNPQYPSDNQRRDALNLVLISQGVAVR